MTMLYPGALPALPRRPHWPIAEERCCSCDDRKAEEGSGFCSVCLWAIKVTAP